VSWVRHVTRVSGPYKNESGGGASHIAGRGRPSASIYTPVSLRRLAPAAVGEAAWIAAPASTSHRPGSPPQRRRLAPPAECKRRIERLRPRKIGSGDAQSRGATPP